MSKLFLGGAIGVALLAAIAMQFRPSTRSARKHVEPPPTLEPPAARAASPCGDWQPLFNGRDLDGWQHLGGGRVSVQDGLLILEHDDERKPGYLVSSSAARDFDARFVCKVVTGDSGFFYRSRRDRRTPTEVTGPQVQLNIEPGRGLGGIFELHGRAWVRKPPRELEAELRRDLDWITCELTARGARISVTINGRRVVEIDDSGADNEFRDAGFMALQIHGGGFLKVLFREVSVRGME